jgi:hypothetical protein
MKEKMAEDAVSNTIIAMCSIEFFSFSFYNFFTSILQKYMVKKKLQNYTSDVVGDSGRTYRCAPRR